MSQLQKNRDEGSTGQQLLLFLQSPGIKEQVEDLPAQLRKFVEYFNTELFSKIEENTARSNDLLERIEQNTTRSLHISNPAARNFWNGANWASKVEWFEVVDALRYLVVGEKRSVSITNMFVTE